MRVSKMRRLLFVVAYALAAGAIAHECLHDHIMESQATVIPHHERHLHTTSETEYGVEIDAHGRALQSTFSNIRIKVDASRLEPYA